MIDAATPTNYKHPHEWLVFSIFIVKERPQSCVPRGEGCVLYAGAFDWQAVLTKKLKIIFQGSAARIFTGFLL